MTALKLVQPMENGQLDYLEESLAPLRHCPPARADEGIVSPVFSRLCIMNPNQGNAQYLTNYGANRYVTKYVAGIDKNNRVYLYGPGKHDAPGAYRVEVEKLKNTKITGNRMAQNITKQSKKVSKDRHEFGKAIAQPDAIMQILGYDQVYTDMKFTHVPSAPLEERPAYERSSPINKMKLQGLIMPTNQTHRTSDLHAPDIIPCHRARLDLSLPHHRQFTPSELTILKDHALSPLSIDATTVYSLRPPELRSIMHQSVYLQCFTRSPISKKDLPEPNGGILDGQYQYCMAKLPLPYNTSGCEWIDGLHHIVCIRHKGLPKVAAYLSAQHTRGQDRVTPDLLQLLVHQLGPPPDSLLSKEGEELPYDWYSSIRPSTGSRFLIHLVLSFGRFSNEYDLWREFTDWPTIFQYCDLLNPADVEASVNVLARQYVMQQLRMIPGGTRTFDRHVVDSFRVITAALQGDEIHTDIGVPSVLYTHMRLAVGKDIDNYIRERRETIAGSTISFLKEIETPNVPSASTIIDARLLNSSASPLHGSHPPPPSGAASNPLPCHHRWSMLTMGKPRQQSPESFQEQRLVLKKASAMLDAYEKGTPIPLPVLCIVGPPGSGKTTCLRTICLDGLGRGLNAFMTAVPAQRALTLGGKHFHITFQYPSKQSQTPPARMAEIALHKLYRRPALLEYLRTCDVGFIDEWGQFSDVMMAFLDILFRRMCVSNAYMGGKLLFCTYDPAQFYPIRARPAMLSPQVITKFRFVHVRELVRSCKDRKLMRAIVISRLPCSALTPAILAEYRELIKTECSFATSLGDPLIPAGAIFVFPHKKPVQAARQKIIEKLRENHGPAEIRTRFSQDEECLTEGHWQQASTVSQRLLNGAVKEMTRLDLFRNVMYEITYNSSHSQGTRNKFAQSQLAVLPQLPPQSRLDSWEPIPILVSPYGFNEAVDYPIDAEKLKGEGWNERTVGPCADRPHFIGSGLKAKRRQYGLRPYVASTCHAIIGHTLNTVVSRVSSTDRDFELWDKQMLVVLQSRTRRLRDLWWISDNKEETATTLAGVLLKKNQYSEYIAHLLHVLSENPDGGEEEEPAQHSVPSTVNQSLHPYRPMDVAVPGPNTSCCYLIISLKDKSATYIGETDDLVSRFRMHNSGLATRQTASRMLAPWALAAFVVGFGDSTQQSHRRAFERQWQNSRLRAHMNRSRNHQPSLSAMEVATLASSIITTKWPEHHLRLILTGTTSSLGSC